MKYKYSFVGVAKPVKKTVTVKSLSIGKGAATALKTVGDGFAMISMETVHE